MVVLLDWNRKRAFDEEEGVRSVEHTIMKGVDKLIKFKWFLKKEAGDSSLVRFSVEPSLPAFTHASEVDLSEEEVFRLELDASELPESWEGDLLIESNGLVNKLPLSFQKSEVIH